MKTYPRGSVRIYDNGGKTADRYTAVYLDQPEGIRHGSQMFACIGMSEHPFHPQGFGEHSTAMLGRHLGRIISRDSLPQDCRLILKREGY